MPLELDEPVLVPDLLHAPFGAHKDNGLLGRRAHEAEFLHHPGLVHVPLLQGRAQVRGVHWPAAQGEQADAVEFQQLLHLPGLGLGGEGTVSFTIATPTGEGVTGPMTFTRSRRCVMVDNLRIW